VVAAYLGSGQEAVARSGALATTPAPQRRPAQPAKKSPPRKTPAKKAAAKKTTTKKTTPRTGRRTP